jgi:hypothetical protein
VRASGRVPARWPAPVFPDTFQHRLSSNLFNEKYTEKAGVGYGAGTRRMLSTRFFRNLSTQAE